MELQNIQKTSPLHRDSFFSIKIIYFLFAAVLLFQIAVLICFGFQSILIPFLCSIFLNHENYKKFADYKKES